MDLRYETIKARLSLLSGSEVQRILDNIDQVCFDEFNYDASEGKYCPLAIAMDLQHLPHPTDLKVKEAISVRFTPVNVIKGVPGQFYTDNRREDLINLCKEILGR